MDVGHQGNAGWVTEDWLELLGPGCVRGFPAAGGHQEEGSEEVECVLAPGSEEGAPVPLKWGFMAQGSCR